MFICMHVCAAHVSGVSGASGGQGRVLDPLELDSEQL